MTDTSIFPLGLREREESNARTDRDDLAEDVKKKIGAGKITENFSYEGSCLSPHIRVVYTVDRQ